ncbi:MAG: glycosyltransferase family 8 C-terminal domain-containing protein [Symbiopectobacterium sp.]
MYYDSACYFTKAKNNSSWKEYELLKAHSDNQLRYCAKHKFYNKNIFKFKVLLTLFFKNHLIQTIEIMYFDSSIIKNKVEFLGSQKTNKENMLHIGYGVDKNFFIRCCNLGHIDHYK